MTGYNLPPGCEVHHLPGNRPEDVAWDEFWESDKPFEIYIEHFGHKVKDDDVNIIYGKYNDDEKFKKLMDKEFEKLYFNDYPDLDMEDSNV